MDIQVIHDEVDSVSGGIAGDYDFQSLGELRRRPVWGNEREVPSGLRLHGAKYVGRSASLIFVVRPSGLARRHGPGRPHIVMQRDRFFIETNYRFSWVIRPFIYFQHVLHLFQILVGQVGHAPHFFPATA
jgi:hypothetical protein